MHSFKDTKKGFFRTFKKIKKELLEKSKPKENKKEPVKTKEVKKEGYKGRIIYKKPANVIYVVNKPQPGQVKGDWAVRSHGKIFSHHRTQENAIKQARKIAKQKNSSVLVQGLDGKFREGFKPKQKTTKK